MVDEFKTLKESLIRSVFAAVASSTDPENPQAKATPSAIRELVSSLALIAGKGKDEIVQIISREIGIAVAGVIKEPVHQILEDRKLKITLELVPKKAQTSAVKTKKKKKTSHRKK